MLERIIFKLTSGRFILTVFAGIAFLYCVVYQIIPVDQIMQILTLIFACYFSRSRTDINK